MFLISIGLTEEEGIILVFVTPQVRKWVSPVSINIDIQISFIRYWIILNISNMFISALLGQVNLFILNSYLSLHQALVDNVCNYLWLWV